MRIKVIGKDGIGWSVDKDRENAIYFLSKIKGVELVDSFLSADIYFSVWYSQLYPKNLQRKMFFVFKRLFNKKIIAFITNDVRDNKEVFNRLKNKVDLWVSPNTKVSEFLKKEEVKYFQIPFYVSDKIFYSLNKTKREIAKELKLDSKRFENKILIGSFQRDSLAGDLTKLKWHKDPDLLIKICKKIPNALLVLAGPRRHYIVSECERHNIDYLFVGDKEKIEKGEDDLQLNNLDEEKVNLLYNLVDVYIVSSKSEGGPKAIMEAALAKTLIFSTDVGLARDFLHKDLIYSEERVGDFVKFFEDTLVDRKEMYIEYNYNKAKEIISEDSYLELYKKLIEKNK